MTKKKSAKAKVASRPKFKLSLPAGRSLSRDSITISYPTGPGNFASGTFECWGQYFGPPPYEAYLVPYSDPQVEIHATSGELWPFGGYFRAWSFAFQAQPDPQETYALVVKNDTASAIVYGIKFTTRRGTAAPKKPRKKKSAKR